MALMFRPCDGLILRSLLLANRLLNLVLKSLPMCLHLLHPLDQVKYLRCGGPRETSCVPHDQSSLHQVLILLTVSTGVAMYTQCGAGQ
jgi:hypothetical protein